MNWYKLAITEKEFYDFYGYSSLSFKDLEDNPKLLYEMIDHINYIRNYYLKYLIKEIATEIHHGIHNILELIENKEDEQYKRIKEKILELSKKLKNNSFEFLTERDFSEAYNIFKNFEWDPVFGGDAWAEITKWTKKLWQVGKIEYEKSTKRVFNRMYRLIMILDTIHSLEHNTNNVLVDLPENERKWMLKALELVKNSKSSYNLITLLENKELKEQLMKNRMIAGEKYDPMINNAYKDYFEVVFNKLKEEEYYDYQNYRFLISQLTDLQTDQIKILFSVIWENLEKTNESNFEFLCKDIFGKLAYNENFVTNLNLLKEALFIAQKIDQSNDIVCLFVKLFTSNLSYIYRYNPKLIKYKIVEYLVDWIKNNNCSIPEEVKSKLSDIYNWG